MKVIESKDFPRLHYKEKDLAAMPKEQRNVKLQELRVKKGLVDPERLISLISIEAFWHPVVVIKHKGELFLFDGNHRVWAARLIGHAMVRAYVIDWDKLKDLKKPAPAEKTDAQDQPESKNSEEDDA